MKILKFFLVVIVGMIVNISIPSLANQWQVSDSCLKMELPDDLDKGFYNPDSIKIDSCPNSLTFGKRYVKNGLYIGFDEYVFFQKPIPSDTIVDYRAIDSIIYYNTYIKFKELSSILGGFYIKREFGVTDSGSLRGRIFEFKIKEYFCYDSLKFFIDSIEYVDLFEFLNIPDSNQWIGVKDIENTNLNSDNYRIYSLPTIQKLYIKIPEKINYNIFRIEIYNMIGLKVFDYELPVTDNLITIDLPNFYNGVYLLKINEAVFKILL